MQPDKDLIDKIRQLDPFIGTLLWCNKTNGIEILFRTVVDHIQEIETKRKGLINPMRSRKSYSNS